MNRRAPHVLDRFRRLEVKTSRGQKSFLFTLNFDPVGNNRPSDRKLKSTRRNTHRVTAWVQTHYVLTVGIGLYCSIVILYVMVVRLDHSILKMRVEQLNHLVTEISTTGIVQKDSSYRK